MIYQHATWWELHDLAYVYLAGSLLPGTSYVRTQLVKMNLGYPRGLAHTYIGQITDPHFII